jgi:hypothetical protein
VISNLKPSAQSRFLPQLRSLRGERDEAFLLENLVQVGVQLKSSGQEAAAAFLLERLSRDDILPEICERAKLEHAGLVGAKHPGMRVEYFLSRLADDHTALKAIFPMLGTTLVGQGVGAILFGGLSRTAVGGILGGVLRKKLAATVGALALEIPTLVGLNHLFSVSGGGDLGDEFLRTGMALGVFRGLSGVSGLAAAGRPGLQRWLQPATTFAGLLGVHQLEGHYGLRPVLENETAVVDTLYSWFTMALGNQLGLAAGGRSLSRFRADAETRIRESSQTQSGKPRLAWATQPAGARTSGEVFLGSGNHPLVLNIKKQTEGGGEKPIRSNPSAQVDRGLLARQASAHPNLPIAKKNRVQEFLAMERANLSGSAGETSDISAVMHRLHGLTNLAYLARLAGLSEEAEALYAEAENQLAGASALSERYMGFIDDCRGAPASREGMRITPFMGRRAEQEHIQRIATLAGQEGPHWLEAAAQAAGFPHFNTRLHAYAELILAALPKGPGPDHPVASTFSPFEPSSAPGSLPVFGRRTSLHPDGAGEVSVSDLRLGNFAERTKSTATPEDGREEFFQALARMKGMAGISLNDEALRAELYGGFSRILDHFDPRSFSREAALLQEPSLAFEMQRRIGLPSTPPQNLGQFKKEMLEVAMALFVKGMRSIESLSTMEAETRIGLAFVAQTFRTLGKKTVATDISKLAHAGLTEDALRRQITRLDGGEWMIEGVDGSVFQKVRLLLMRAKWPEALAAVTQDLESTQFSSAPPAALAYLSHILDERPTDRPPP